jgi:beta-glucosidase
MSNNRWPATLLAVAGLLTFAALASAQGGRGRGGVPAVTGPWSDKTLSPDQRADLVIAAMTLDEKIQLLHGGPGGMGGAPAVMPPGIVTRSNGGAGWVPGIPRLGIPDVNMADSAVGVTRGDTESRYSTLLPSSLWPSHRP